MKKQSINKLVDFVFGNVYTNKIRKIQMEGGKLIHSVYITLNDFHNLG